MQHLIQSPFNYMGGKYRILSQILPLFPRDISVGIDLFCGGASVGMNLAAKRIILNDILTPLIEIYKLFQRKESNYIFREIFNIIETFNLSNSAQNGYKFYNCNSSNGLGKYNKTGFLELKNYYNQSKDAIALFVLIVFSFNNQIRFNSKNYFNLPCGKRDFNARMQNKLKIFINNLKNKEISNKDFRNFDLSICDKKSFIYIDPPYFLATAPYNENNAWNMKDENDLLDWLKMLDKKNIRFALSNAIYHKGKEHKILKSWLESNAKFKTHYLNFSYQNCNYQTRKISSQEVLITNYDL